MTEMNAQKLLDHFDRIAEAPDAVSRLRQFILDLAVRGKLVEQDENDEPASILLKKIINEKSTLDAKNKNGNLCTQSLQNTFDNVNYSIPKSWIWVTIGSIIIKHLGGGTPSKSNHSYWNGEISWASVKDIGKSKYLYQTIDTITKSGLENSSSNLISSNNLIVVTRMGLGKVSINKIPIAINQQSITPTNFGHFLSESQIRK